MPEVPINGPEGRIEGRYFHSKTPNAPLALRASADPLLAHGGALNHGRALSDR